MRRIVSFIIIFISVFSCDRYNDPATETVRNYNFSFETAQLNKFTAGSLVSDSVAFAVNPFNIELNSMTYPLYGGMLDSFNVVFEVIKGGGKLTRQSVHTDKNRKAYTGWTLGTESCEQKLRAKAYDLNGKYLAYSDLTEYGFRTNQWDEFSGYPDGIITSMATDTINKVTLIVSGNNLYKQGETYYTWGAVYPGAYGITAVNIDKNGIFYINSGNGNLYKSTDHGDSWIPCVSPFNDQAYTMSLYISNDNYLWASMAFHSTRLSKDGGQTWSNVGNEVSLHGPGNFFRLKNGSILFHGDDCCSFYRSVDEGMTWTKIVSPGPTVKLYVNDKEEIFIITSENGLTIYRSTDNALNFNKVFSTIPDGLYPMGRTFIKWHNSYYVLIPGWGILTSADLIHYQEYWFNANLSNLFIDHNGVLIAKDKNGTTVYYFKS